VRVTYRNLDTRGYWTARWSDIPVDHPMERGDIYPLKYAEETIKDRSARILEAGCGAGRIFLHYHNQGMDIVGIDFIEVAIDNLKKLDTSLKVEVGDITSLAFGDQSFKYILAFGLYHNLEYGLDKAIKETYRILENGGSVCASFRADNIQTKLVDWLANRKEIHDGKNDKLFHKMNLTRREFKEIFEKFDFIVDAVTPVENMPILYKFSFFRSSSHRQFDENIARVEGYQLSWIGQKFQNILMNFFPNQFCNIYVLIAHKA
jgi:SAM-dependent methyltransferase